MGDDDDVFTDPTDHFVLEIYGGHSATSRAADCTGDAGWYWYCDDHDTHGTADDEAEARAMLEAHRNWFRHHRHDDGNCEGRYAFDVAAAAVAYRQLGYHDRLD